MTSWATITLDLDGPNKDIPTGLLIDSGIDEQGWVEEDSVYFALSNGRYQHKRFIQHAHDFHSPRFNGVRRVVVCDVEDTGDTVTAYVLAPNQDTSTERIDGFRVCDEIEGRRWPDEEREELRSTVEIRHGMRPQIEPVETITPADMVMTKTDE